MSLLSFSFAGSDLALFGGVMTVDEPTILPPREDVSVSVPGMPGAYLARVATTPRIFSVPIFIGRTQRAEKRRELAAWLAWDTPQALVFSAEPDKTYYAICAGETALTPEGSSVLTFVCHDPYAYASSREETGLDAGENAIVVSGGAATYPTIEVTLADQTSFVEVVNTETDEYVRVGAAPGMIDDSSPEEPYLLKFDDACTALTNWTASDLDTIGSTTAAMSLKVSSGKFVIDSAGSGTGWHGPMYFRPVSQSPNAVVNFRVQAQIQANEFDTVNRLGLANIVLHDSSEGIFAWIGLGDVSTTVAAGWLHVYVKGADRTSAGLPLNYLHYGYYPANQFRWVNLYGDGSPTVQIARQDDVWSFGVYTPRYGWDVWSWIDSEGVATDYTLDNVGVQLLDHSTVTEMPYLSVNNVRVDEILGPENPYYFKANDAILFDMEDGTVLLNGGQLSEIPTFGGFVPMNALVDIGSTFFPLEPGAGTLAVYADDGVTVYGTLSVLPRWL